MTHALYEASWIILAYVIGSIPFGFLVALWARGIDIRTVGSGNIGATNVGRTLGFRFFVIVFTLDLLKGFLPTYGFPRVVEGVTGGSTGALGVLIALATILGHNFPLFLKFRGGKGVATSLGALLALDAPAALSAAAGFGVSLLISRYVSVSSISGGVVFAAVHFARSRAPWSKEEIAMTSLTIVLLILLIVRHRKNFTRIRSGTEPKVPLRKGKKPPGGRIASWLLLVVAGVSVALGLVLDASRRTELNLAGCTLAEVSRVATGHQRAERLAFADRGRLLAVTCPRYNRVVLYRVTPGNSLEIEHDIMLEGRPVAICPADDRLYVLQRPPGDARHIEPGYWETYDFQGRRIGSKYRVGFYPDDFAFTSDGRHALVLTSGKAEGGLNRPEPALAVIALDADAGLHREVGRVSFDHRGDDPERLALSASGRWGVATLLGSNQAATLDLSDPSHPSVVGRSARATDGDRMTPLAVSGDAFPAPIAPEGGAVRLDLPGVGSCVVVARPRDSAIDLLDADSRRTLGRLPIRGAMNLSPTRPTGLAQEPSRGLIAVATRSGGVYLLAVRPRPVSQPRDIASSGARPAPR